MNRIIDAKQGAGLVLILSISLTAIFSTPAAAETVEFSEMKFEGGRDREERQSDIRRRGIRNIDRLIIHRDHDRESMRT